MKTSGKIGVGIVGLSARGGWAATAHVPALRALSDNFELVGLSASSIDSARAAAEKHNVPYYTVSAEELARRADVDLVVVSVKVPDHRMLVEAALTVGKMVYCEWPLGNGLDEAAALAKLAQSRGIKTFVGLQARAAPSVRYLRDLIADGYVGELISTTLVASGDFPWGGVATSATTYVNDKSTGASMLTIPFGHTIDALCWILGDFCSLTASLATRRPEVKVTDTNEIFHATTPDQVAVTGVLQNGMVVSAHYRGGRSRGTNFLWEINGQDGDLIITGHDGHLQYGHIRIQGGNEGSQVLSDLSVPERYQLVATDPASYHNSVAHAYRNLLGDIRNGTHEVPSFGDALAPHRLLDRIERAAAE